MQNSRSYQYLGHAEETLNLDLANFEKRASNLVLSLELFEAFF